MKVSYLIFLIFILCINKVFSQYNISGRVLQNKNQKPLYNASVFLKYTPHLSKTDSNGYYEISNVSPGKYEIVAFTFGYEMLSKKIHIKDSDTTVNFRLKELNKEFDQVTIKAGKKRNFGYKHLNSVDGMGIYEGKKTEVVLPDKLPANKATNRTRQIFSKVPGINIWQSDYGGIQLDIGARGLNPKRSAHFNVRQNGYDISADPLGYPESYYTPPMEAVESIEVVKGAASLQYGPQFGGMVNFNLKDSPEDKKIKINTRQTIGSFGLFNSFNSVGGNYNKFNYYGYLNFKTGNGWRPNSQFNLYNGFVKANYKLNDKLNIGLELTKYYYKAQQPGGLTESMFENNPRQSRRSRNWFSVDWNMAALNLDYKLNSKIKINSRFFGLKASRKALGNLNFINRVDIPSEPRNLIWDKYNNFGNETRLLAQYEIFDNSAALITGIRYYQGLTNRRQGLANSSNSPDFQYLHPNNLENFKYDFPSRNLSLFAENIFPITPEFSLTPGIRFEHIRTVADGFFNNRIKKADSIIYQNKIHENRKKIRNFFLMGIGASYKPQNNLEIYANFSQNYRAINFNDMRIKNPNFRVDPQLKDERGFNADLGFKGNFKRYLNFDASLFYLYYNNRIGNIIKKDTILFNNYRFRTNISDSRNYGIEAMIESDIFSILPVNINQTYLNAFINFTYLDAKYINSKEAAFENNEVEQVPPVMVKTGINFIKKNFKASLLYSYTHRHFTDATNAKNVPGAIFGIIPSYYVMDLSFSYKYKFLNLETGVNNLTDYRYFTRRATGYPGPGIIPAPPRNFYLTIGAEF